MFVKLIIQVNPQKIAQVKTALLTIPHTEIPAEDEKGKLVVVTAIGRIAGLLNHMENSRNIDGVIDLSLVIINKMTMLSNNLKIDSGETMNLSRRDFMKANAALAATSVAGLIIPVKNVNAVDTSIAG